MYNVPIIFLIGWRGFEKNDAPEHIKIGKIQPKLLDLIGLKSKIITEKNWKSCCNWALKNSKKQSCALIVRRLVDE